MSCRTILVASMLAVPTIASAQQATTSAPLTSQHSRFNEQFGGNFGLDISGGSLKGGNSRVVGFNRAGVANPNGGIQIRQGGFNNVRPAFGGGNTATPTTAGFAISGGNFGANFGFSGIQGNTTSSTSQSPIITSLNGQPASFNSQVQQPFVTGVTPVVNQWVTRPKNPNSVFPFNTAGVLTFQPIRQSLSRLQSQPRALTGSPLAAAGHPRIARHSIAGKSTASVGAVSIAEIRRRQAGQDIAHNLEAQTNFDRARVAERAGKIGVAKIFYRMATRDAVGALKQQAEQRLESLSNSRPKQ